MVFQPYLESPPFNWTLSRYIRVMALSSLAWMITCLLLVPFLKRVLRCRDTLMGAFAFLSLAVSRVLFLSAWRDTVFLIDIGVGVGTGTAVLKPALWALLSTHSDADEQAKVFAIDTAIWLVFAPLGGALYAALLGVGVAVGWPPLLFAVPVLVSLGGVACFMLLYCDEKRQERRSDKS